MSLLRGLWRAVGKRGRSVLRTVGSAGKEAISLVNPLVGAAMSALDKGGRRTTQEEAQSSFPSRPRQSLGERAFLDQVFEVLRRGGYSTGGIVPDAPSDNKEMPTPAESGRKAGTRGFKR